MYALYPAKIKNRSRGFTLVEIAIVLLIIGLLIGGILRGQELITSARVRNIIDQKSSVQAAIVGFQDRYKMQPGDLTTAQATIVGPGINAARVGSQGDGVISWPDSVTLFQNIARTGFIDCSACATAANAVPFPTNTIVNAYADALWFGNDFIGGPLPAGWTNPWMSYLAPAQEPQRQVLSTGAGIPPQVLAEVDRKADDGFPATGSFRQHGLAGIVVGNLFVCSPLNTVTNRYTWANPNTGNGAGCQGGWLF